MRKFMRLLALFMSAAILSLTLTLLWPWAPHYEIGDNETHFALNHISVIDTIEGGITQNQTVVIRDGKIVEIVNSEKFVAPAGLVVIDASNRYLMPGLWDMHTHSLKISPELHHPLFIRYGVTSVRDMSGCLSEDDSFWACPEDRRRWQQEAVEGKRVSPRYPMQSSYQTNGGNEVPSGFPDFFKLRSAKDAEELVGFYNDRDVDFIKTYTELTPEQFASLSTAASQGNIALAGHRPIAVSLEDSINANMLSIEHGRLFMFECYEEAEEFRALDNPIAHYNSQFIRQLIEGQDGEVCRELMTKMARSNTRWVPTLSTIRMSAMSQNPEFRTDARLATIPWIVQKVIWEQDANRAATRGNDDAGRFVHGEFFVKALAQVKAAHDAGVQILAGTDNIDTYVFTGASLHDELALFVEAGLSPLAAIQTATIEPARFAGLESEFGSVTIGKKADLIVLDGNPLVDVKNTTRINAVVFAGRYLSEHDLAAMEQSVEISASSFQINWVYLYNMLTSPLMRMQLVD